MNTVEQGVIALMKSAITGEKSSLPEDFDFQQAYTVLKRHNIPALGYAGGLRCGLDRKSPFMQQLFRDYCASTLVSERQMAAAERIFEAFQENGIHFMPVKGCIMKQIYPQPELRGMGDADILIRMEQYEKIRPIMQSLGYTEGEIADHALVWESAALEVELHRRLIPSTDREYFEYYGDGWSKAARAEGYHHYMTKEDQFLFIFTHFVKHFRGAGIGLRHLLDLWVYLRRYPDLDQAYLNGELKKLGLEEFFANIRSLLLGLFEDGPMDDKSQAMAAYIFSNGAWGTMQNALLSEGLKESRQRHSTKKGRMAWMLHMIFPDYRYMMNHYSPLKKLPVLLPVFWVVRWFEILLFRRENIGVRVRHMQTMSDENITGHQKMLDYFGLPFEADAEE